MTLNSSNALQTVSKSLNAGATLKETAEKILQQAQDAKTTISTAKLNLSGTIRIAASTIPGEHIIPSLIAEFQKKYPDVKFKIKAQDSLNSLTSLQANDADFAAVGTLQGFEEKFDFLQIGEEQLVLIVPCNHELSKHKTSKLKEILAYPFINREETSGTRKEIEGLFEKNNIHPQQLQVALELGSTESVITAVSEGRGISIISSIAAKKAQAAGLIKIVKIEEAKNSQKTLHGKTKKTASEDFRGFLGILQRLQIQKRSYLMLHWLGVICIFVKFNPDFSRLNFPFKHFKLHGWFFFVFASFQVEAPIMAWANNYQAIKGSA